jgi:hypothetical protein
MSKIAIKSARYMALALANHATNDEAIKWQKTQVELFHRTHKTLVTAEVWRFLKNAEKIYGPVAFNERYGTDHITLQVPAVDKDGVRKHVQLVTCPNRIACYADVPEPQSSSSEARAARYRLRNLQQVGVDPHHRDDSSVDNPQVLWPWVGRTTSGPPLLDMSKARHVSLAKALHASQEEYDAIRAAFRERYNEALSAIRSFGTYKKLSAGWPDAMSVVGEFFPATVSNTGTALVANVAALNKDLKLPPK